MVMIITPSPHTTSTVGRLCMRSERQRVEMRRGSVTKSLFSSHHDAVLESETMKEAMPVGTFQNAFSLPQQLRCVLGAVLSHSFMEKHV